MHSGFITGKRLCFWKIDERNLEEILRMCAPKCQTEKECLEQEWGKRIKKEKDDYNNFSFIVKNRKKKPVGLVTFETENQKDFRIIVFVPNVEDANRWKDYIIESILQYVEDFTNIWTVYEMVFKNDLQDGKYEVIGTNYDFIVSVSA